MHQFLVPISNRRADDYGGSLGHRMRFPLEVAKALRDAWPKERILGARITASDWAERGATPEDCVRYATELKSLGFDYVCVSSGGIVLSQKIKLGPGYQVAFAEKVKKEAGIAVRAVGDRRSTAGRRHRGHGQGGHGLCPRPCSIIPVGSGTPPSAWA